MTNDGCYKTMLRMAEKRGENVVFVLEDHPVLKGWCRVCKVPVPGELDREKHFVAAFMHLTAFHGPHYGPFEQHDPRLDTLYREA